MPVQAEEPAALRTTPGLCSSRGGRRTSGRRGAARGAAAILPHTSAARRRRGVGRTVWRLRVMKAIRKPQTKGPAGAYAQRVNRHGQTAGRPPSRAGQRYFSAVTKWPLEGVKRVPTPAPPPRTVSPTGKRQRFPCRSPRPFNCSTPSFTLNAHL